MCKYRFGIEEEYFLVNRRNARLRCELPQAFMRAAKRKLGARLMTELLQSQVEVATPPMETPADARGELLAFRTVLSEIGRQHGVGIVAAGTHPLADPRRQRITRKRRYSKVIEDLGMIGLGNALCGLHVHVEVPDPDLRVGIMHRLVPFLPLLLALSTSSPFWAGRDTGLLGYRNAANDALPRTGFPEMFQSLADYESYVRALVEAGIIADSTYIWWSLRPSLQHPTLELRITDCCTAVSDAVAIASLYRALVRHLVRRRGVNREFSAVARALSEENRWTAQRYGTEGTYVDASTRTPMAFLEMLEETIELVADDVAALSLEEEMRHLGLIAKRGTSAHLQRMLYQALVKSGRSSMQAMADVAKWLQASTERGEFVEQQPPANGESCSGAAGTALALAAPA